MNHGFKKYLLVLLLVLGGGLAVIFNFPAFMPVGNNAALPFLNPSQMLFDNDAPLGYYKAEQNHVPDSMFGTWGNLYWIGGEGVGEAPRVSTTALAILGPELYVKYFPFLSVLFLGFCAFVFLRQLKFNPAVCVFGGLAAGLNMHFFSISAWGLTAWSIAAGAVFLALAALTTNAIRQFWARALLAGVAVGVVIMEGFDSGAILSIYVGIFIVFAGWYLSDEAPARRMVKTGITAALVVGFSALLSCFTISTLVSTQIKAVAGTEQKSSKAQTPEEIEKAKQELDRRWAFSTQWSLPKLETLRLFIPGLMGYHMYENVDGPDKSSAYWGRIGEDLGLTAIREMRRDPNPEVRRQADEAMRSFGGYRRHIGSGDYAGLLVMILAAFAAVNSFRKTGPFSERERRFVWFWTVAALISLILAFGRHAFLYQFLFKLPYFSTTRNPIKFLHPFFISVLILNAYGAEALWRNYLRAPVRAFGEFEKRWLYSWLGAVVVAVFGLMVLVSKKEELVHYLSLSGVVPGTESQLASFCIAETVWFVVFLIASVALMTLIIRGVWAGKQAKWAVVAMGVLLLCDVGRADRYWLKYYNYKEKYALNPVLDFLHQDAYEKKSTAKLMPFGHYDISACPEPRTPYDNNFYAVCNEWLQNQFPYYNIQALDIVQAPRTAEMDNNLATTFTPRTAAELPICARLWQLTNTRYIFCWTGFLNRPLYQGGPSLQGLDPSGNAFQVRTRLNVIPAPGVTVPTTSADLTMEVAKDGEFALVEYTNTLPRVKLYANWQTTDGAESTLATLKSASFDPQKVVLVAKDTPVAAKPTDTADAGSAKIEDYHPKYIKVRVNANVGSVLLLNEHWSPHWQVLVDNKEIPLLQCNYLMKGVYVDKGQHIVEFKFRPPQGSLYVTLAGWGLGILVAGFVIVTNRRNGQSFASGDSASKDKSVTAKV
jgi:hypothetical protein